MKKKRVAFTLYYLTKLMLVLQNTSYAIPKNTSSMLKLNVSASSNNNVFVYQCMVMVDNDGHVAEPHYGTRWWWLIMMQNLTMGQGGDG